MVIRTFSPSAYVLDRTCVICRREQYTTSNALQRTYVHSSMKPQTQRTTKYCCNSKSNQTCEGASTNSLRTSYQYQGAGCTHATDGLSHSIYVRTGYPCTSGTYVPMTFCLCYWRSKMQFSSAIFQTKGVPIPCQISSNFGIVTVNWPVTRYVYYIL